MSKETKKLISSGSRFFTSGNVCTRYLQTQVLTEFSELARTPPKKLYLYLEKKDYHSQIITVLVLVS